MLNIYVCFFFLSPEMSQAVSSSTVRRKKDKKKRCMMEPMRSIMRMHSHSERARSRLEGQDERTDGMEIRQADNLREQLRPS